MAHPAKRLCTEPKATKRQLDDLNKLLQTRLNAMDKKMDLLINACTSILVKCEESLKEHACCSQIILPKINLIDEIIRSLPKLDVFKDMQRQNPVILLTNKGAKDTKESTGDPQVIALNSAIDYPSGSWLGDKDKPRERVRVKIPPSILLHINERCITPEKMALTLVDYLFPKEVLAISNLSGRGKHCKQQLDPLLIYGIKCHLIYKFNITEVDWLRIRLNIDSKCRAEWRKKMGEINNSINKSTDLMLSETISDESSDDSHQTSVLNLENNSFKVLRQRQNQFLQMEDGQIEVFTDEEFKELLPTSVELFSVEDNDCFSLTNQMLIVRGNGSPEKVLEEDPVFVKDDD